MTRRCHLHETILLLHVGIVPGGAVDKILEEGLEEGQRTWSLEVARRHVACGDEQSIGLVGSGRTEEGGDIPGGLENVVAVEGRTFCDKVG